MNQVSHDQSQKKLNKCEFLKRTVQFVLSVSVFYFFVWYSSGFSILPQSFNAYFSTCLFSMLTRTLQRKYMFLICNAILALLAKTSLLTLSPSISAASDIEFQASNLSDTKELVSEEAVFPVESFHSPENASLIVEEEVEQVEKQEEYYDQQVSEAEEEEEEEGNLFTETEGRENEEASIAEEEEEEEEEVEGIKDEEDEEGGTGSGVMVIQDDELVETTKMVTNEELANTDELNRKFEEFIRKMKEEIRIEAQTHPIAV